MVWLIAAAVAAVAGGLLAWLLGATPLWAVVAWVISGPVAFGLLARSPASTPGNGPRASTPAPTG